MSKLLALCTQYYHSRNSHDYPKQPNKHHSKYRIVLFLFKFSKTRLFNGFCCRPVLIFIRYMNYLDSGIPFAADQQVFQNRDFTALLVSKKFFGPIYLQTTLLKPRFKNTLSI